MTRPSKATQSQYKSGGENYCQSFQHGGGVEVVVVMVKRKDCYVIYIRGGVRGDSEAEMRVVEEEKEE